MKLLMRFAKSEIEVFLTVLYLLVSFLSDYPCTVAAKVDTSWDVHSVVDDGFNEFADPDDLSTVDLSEPPNRQQFAKTGGDPSSSSNKKNGGSPARSEVSQSTVEETVRRHTEPDDDSPPLHLSIGDAVTGDKRSEFHAMNHDDDDEEFEGLPPLDSSASLNGVGGDSVSSSPSNSGGASSGSAGGDKSGKPNLIIAKLPQGGGRLWRDYHFEMLIVVLLGVYFFNFLSGRTKNTILATAWFQSHRPLLEENFALVGDDGLAEPGSGTLVKESEHVYSLWCSGRVYCEAMMVELRLLKRQCLLFTLANWFQPCHDNIIVKVIMEEGEMDGWVLAIGRRRRIQTLVKDHQDLTFFCSDKRGQKHPELPDSFSVVSEIPEACTSMLNAAVCKFLNEHEDSIEYLYFSDQYTGPKPPQDEAASSPPPPQRVLIFCFKIGNKGTVSPEDMEAMVPLFQFIFYTVDKVRRLHLSKESKTKSERNRHRAHDSRLKIVHSKRQEAAQSRREQKMREVKERIMSTDDPEMARKLEEREMRKNKAKRQPKMKAIKI